MIVAFGVAGLVAAIDWWAVRTGRRSIESIAKPLVMVALIVVALLVDAQPEGARWWVIAGLAFGLVGDLCLLPWVDRFVEGLAAFLLGHVMYAVGLALMFDGRVALVAGVIVAAAAVTAMARPILRAIRGHRLQLPVTVYMGVVAVVVALGFATGRGPIAVGTVLFAMSDGLLGANRFVAPAPQRRVVIHVLYHLGQAGIVVGLHAPFA